MKVAYICAPYRAATDSERWHNIERARRAAEYMWSLGYAVICPHMNSAFMSGAASEKAFLDGYVEIVKRCDLVAVMDAELDMGFTITSGMRAEIKAAVEAGKDVFWFRDLDPCYGENLTAVNGEALLGRTPRIERVEVAK